MDIEREIEDELRYFNSDEERDAFLAVRVPASQYVAPWQYGPEKHTCVVVASDGKQRIVYCRTGFGPEFSWSAQNIGWADIGMDSEWHAYLYEAFVCSSMWPFARPKGFVHMARGERIA